MRTLGNFTGRVEGSLPRNSSIFFSSLPVSLSSAHLTLSACVHPNFSCKGIWEEGSRLGHICWNSGAIPVLRGLDMMLVLNREGHVRQAL